MYKFALALAVLVLSGCNGQSPSTEDPPGGEISPAATLGFDPASFDQATRPQDDIWQHVNGIWMAETEIPPEWPAWSAGLEIYERTEAQIRSLVEDAGQQQGAESGSDAQKIGDLYRSFMDTDAIAKAGLDGLAEDFARIDALESHENVVEFMGYGLRARIGSPIGAYIDADGSNPERNLFYAWQSGLTLPDRDYYLEDSEKYATMRGQLADHIAKLFALAERDDGTEAAAAIVALEGRIARAHWPSEETRRRELTYANQFTLDDAIEASGGFPWPTYFKGAGSDAPDVFVMATDTYFAELQVILNETPVEVWQSYFRFNLLEAWARYLPTAFVDESFDFHSRKLRGQQEQHPRWRRGVSLVNGSLGEMLGRVYVEKHFSPQTKARVQEMVANLRTAFGQSIDGLAWMSEQTKSEARDKLAKFDARIGYPDTWRDYSALDIGTEIVANVREIREFEFQFEYDKLSNPVDRSEWGMTPQTVNAYYRPTFNVIAFPAAYIQPPHFDPAADDAYNYGAMGSTIGHEFSHGFDDQGRKFDGDGRLRDWWTEDDATEYKNRAENLVEWYNAFQPLPDVALNGRLTLGENIGDLAGLIMAFRAWRISLGSEESPVINGYTGEQRFFLGWVYAYRGKMREGFLRQILLSDPHSPNEFRVKGVLPHVREFYDAFAIGPGDGMYLEPEARVKIW